MTAMPWFRPKPIMMPLLMLLGMVAIANCVSLTVSKTGGKPSSEHLYGFMFEDINHSGDGGLHGQLLRNNGFQGFNPGLTAWSAVGAGATIAIDSNAPLSSALPRSLRVNVPRGSTGQVGVANEGYWGIPVQKGTYSFYFWVRGAYSGPATVKLVSTTGSVFATNTITINSKANSFTYYETTFASTEAPDERNRLQLTFDAAKLAGSPIWVDLLQLFPPTFHNRKNGLKADIAKALDDIKGSFLRFPGGNNLEGGTVDGRWKWKNTVGPLHLRPGRQGTWGYPNTDALGLLEYLYWCEDMKLTPVMGVWAGLTLGKNVITGDALKPYIQEALDQIEYVVGSTSTTYGALRASHGRAAPFDLKYVEIGNEDNLAGGLPSYAGRFKLFHDAIKAKYPQITIISSTDQGLPNPKPAGMWMDVHVYARPIDFVNSFHKFDNYDRRVPIMLGEYAVTGTNSGGKLEAPNLIGAVAEAVYMIGLERNSDVVKMAAYAPLLQRFGQQQWVPDLIGFTSNPRGLTLSTSYHVQKLFSANRGTTILPVTADSAFGPVYWVASVNANTGTHYVKLANYSPTSQSITIMIPGATSGSLTTVTGPSESSTNTPGKTVVAPVTTAITGSGGRFKFTAPAWSAQVLAVK